MAANVHDEIKDSLVEIAQNIFSRFGYKKTTVDEIAQAARKGKSSIYYYFKSKEDIFKAVVDKEASILFSRINEAIETKENPKEKLKAYILTRMEAFKDLANFYDAVKNDLLAHMEFINKFREKHYKKEIQVIEQILQLGINNNEFNIKNPEITAIAISTAMKGLEIPVFFKRETINLENRLDELLDVLFFGLIKR